MSETEKEIPDNTENDGTDGNVRQVEVERGPLLPRWAKIGVFTVLIPFILFAFGWIGHSMVIQHNILKYLDVLSGPWDGEPPAMESEVVADGRDLFEEKARSSLLFVLQRMVVEEINDPRMAKAITLRKAMEWGDNSEKREFLNELLDHMDSDGAIAPSYELSKEDREVLEKLIEKRKARDTDSYEEKLITKVLVWIADGRPTQAKGPERRRIVALKNKYDKRVFLGEEKEILKTLAEDWAETDNEVKQAAAEKFEMMLDEEACSLSTEAVEICREEADEWEDDYLVGQERLSEIAVHLVKHIEKTNVFIDHPDIWEVIRLCQHRYKPVRENMKDATYALRNRKYCLMFLSDFLRKAEINPVMAVETARLTKEEHEDLLERENHRRRMAGLDVAERIAADYCESPYDIEGVPEEDTDEYFKRHIIETVGMLTEDDNEDIAERAEGVWETISKECDQHIQQ